MTHPVLIAGQWRPAEMSGSFRAKNPTTGETLPDEYPVSRFADIDAALEAAHAAFHQLRASDGKAIVRFLRNYAERIDAASEAICAAAHAETGLPIQPRLAAAELPRTTGQLRQAADAAENGSWRQPTIDTANNIRSYLNALGPVAVYGPNNFPLAFNGISGGDFAAALAAGNPVIAKAHPLHPTTSRLLGELAHAAATEVGLPPGTVQMLYRISREDGPRLVSDPRIAATGFTGSRTAGLALKQAAEAAGKLIYLEMSSINPVLILPGALAERSEAIADEYTASCLMGAGQFCTNPGLVILLATEATPRFVDQLVERFSKANAGVLLSADGAQGLGASVEAIEAAGAELLTGGDAIPGPACRFANTLLKTTASRFLEAPEAFQTEAFGNAALIVIADDGDQAQQVVAALEGNLTGCIYSHTGGEDDALYAKLEPGLRVRVGRLLNDKMPTGVAVSPAMNHGGPYPATAHPGFTAVGIPAAMRRFAQLECFDGVRSHRLPPALADKNPTGTLWRLVDGQWSQRDLEG